jgi:hypothetical protein
MQAPGEYWDKASRVLDLGITKASRPRWFFPGEIVYKPLAWDCGGTYSV